ncbi:pilin [Patescibacteria group bacterium]|nr:pilin [Patescibacteria group bacterium]
MKAFLKTCYYSTAAGLLSLPSAALAAGENPFDRAKNLTNQVGSTAFGSQQQADLPTMIGRIINIALGFIGILLLVYLVYGGFLWMTSGGSDEGVKKAQTMIKNAVIGLVIVVAAFAISNFVLLSLVNVTTG